MKKAIPVILLSAMAASFFCSCRPAIVAVRPAAVVSIRPVRPSPAHVWINGGYVRNGRSYRYVDGYWSVPRRNHRTYVEGYWRPSRRGYVWVPGYWR